METFERLTNGEVEEGDIFKILEQNSTVDLILTSEMDYINTPDNKSYHVNREAYRVIGEMFKLFPEDVEDSDNIKSLRGLLTGIKNDLSIDTPISDEKSDPDIRLGRAVTICLEALQAYESTLQIESQIEPLV